jgi:hypothetical protein
VLFDKMVLVTAIATELATLKLTYVKSAVKLNQILHVNVLAIESRYDELGTVNYIHSVSRTRILARSSAFYNDGPD